MSEEGMRRVTAIQNGTIIDHVPAGSCLKVLGMLGLLDSRSTPISLACLLYTSPSPRDLSTSRMPSSA